MKRNKFYITTAIDYINAKPHIGHAYEKILADVMARYYREIRGAENVFFLTGSDEHGTKIEQAASNAGKSPQEFADQIVDEFIKMKELCGLSWDRFIRTTDADHILTVQELWRRCSAKGDIYKKKYQGMYCIGCESFKKESDLINGKCPDHDCKPDIVEEENYFFKLSNYKDTLQQKIESGELAFYPLNKKTEVLNILNDLEDFSISRPIEKNNWGIPVPNDSSQNMYVWFDALTNYFTGSGGFDTSNKWWPADVHMVGKDITRFHIIYWPAMLLSGDLELPHAIFAHGFVTADGKKMSKTLGNIVSINDVVEKYGVDGFRYFMLSEGNIFDDLDFTWERIETRYNSDLANALGNLVSRVTNLAEKNEIVYNPENRNFQVQFIPIQTLHNRFDAVSQYDLKNVLEMLWKNIRECNSLIDDKKPWAMEDKGEVEKIINDLLYEIKIVGEVLIPFLPETSEKILKIFDGGKIVKAEPLFPKKVK